jgi:hypothetical protein
MFFRQPNLNLKIWDFDHLSLAQGGGMRTDPCCSPICVGYCINPGSAFFDNAAYKLVNKMRVRTMVAAPLFKG